MEDIAKAAAATFAAIGSLYLWRRSRLAFVRAMRDVVTEAQMKPSETSYFDRDSSSEIAKRTISLTSSAIVLSWAVGFPVSLTCSRAARSTGHMTAIIASLWFGPIVESPAGIFNRVKNRLRELWHHPMGAVRELIVAPIAEELIFRHALLTILGRRSPRARICISAILFAAAHIHLITNNAVESCRNDVSHLTHTYGVDSASNILSIDEKRTELSHRAWAAAKRQTGTQVAMVFLYGLLCGWVYEHCCERSVTAAVIGHSLCNFTSVPPFFFLRRNCGGKKSTMSVAHRVVSGVAHLAGVVGAVALASAKAE
ncbi:type II CAAX prenyl protease, putative [Bodo saltans]|uniref:intramembrane prenyl-peptidase Rce1 n=1 Tax=Bodo saltans TaxID=75058 RepID=A0A0S4JSY4_BODSA|nr:type II CAAX prenyl protease, putative [Bodo saltans]|eukprot:CUG92515.1 type II CAAX prenyl protease, putative [Bodo saltans]